MLKHPRNRWRQAVRVTVWRRTQQQHKWTRSQALWDRPTVNIWTHCWCHSSRAVIQGWAVWEPRTFRWSWSWSGASSVPPSHRQTGNRKWEAILAVRNARLATLLGERRREGGIKSGQYQGSNRDKSAGESAGKRRQPGKWVELSWIYSGQIGNDEQVEAAALIWGERKSGHIYCRWETGGVWLEQCRRGAEQTVCSLFCSFGNQLHKSLSCSSLFYIQRFHIILCWTLNTSLTCQPFLCVFEWTDVERS